jgi:hypothetical protein
VITDEVLHGGVGQQASLSDHDQPVSMALSLSHDPPPPGTTYGRAK